MSRDWNEAIDGPLPVDAKPKELPDTKRYPICPQCGCNTLVMFSPPRPGLVGTDEGYRLYGDANWAEYVDWSRAHLYCCNGETNCNVKIDVIGGAMSPINEKRRRFVEVS